MPIENGSGAYAEAFPGVGTFTELSPLKMIVILADETAVLASETTIPCNEIAVAMEKSYHFSKSRNTFRHISYSQQQEKQIMKQQL